tara:strand:+ start:266 stop:460 length:195 start_codon:yes stop_codon:yes gene_type:complete
LELLDLIALLFGWEVAAVVDHIPQLHTQQVNKVLEVVVTQHQKLMEQVVDMVVLVVILMLVILE